MNSEHSVGVINYTEVREYNPNCYQCRAIAGRESAGIKEDDLCEYHLQQYYEITAPILKQILEQTESLKCCGNCGISYTTENDTCYCVDKGTVKSSNCCDKWQSDNMTRKEREIK